MVWTKAKNTFLSLLAAGALLLAGCHAEPDGDGSLNIQDWITGEADRTEIARSVGAAGTNITQEAAAAASDVLSGLFDGAGIKSLADFMPTPEDLAGFLPERAADGPDDEELTGDCTAQAEEVPFQGEDNDEQTGGF